MSRTSKRTPKILVVDDDPGLLRLLTIRLRSQNYEVEPAENAAKALAVIARFRPDLVITDLRMAEMDGIALLRELQRRWPSLNVIMLTAHGTIPDAVKATQSGAFAFLTKPVEKEQLLEEVRRALKTSGFADTAEEWRDRVRHPQPAGRGPPRQGAPGRGHRFVGADHRRARHRQGTAGAGDPPRERRREGAFVSVDCSALDGSRRAPATASRNWPSRSGSHRRHDLPAQRGRPRPEPADAPREPAARPRDVRVLATSDRRPDELAADGRYSTELLERVSAVHIDLPPLGKRREDIPAAGRAVPRRRGGRDRRSRSARCRRKRWKRWPSPSGRATSGNCAWSCARLPSLGAGPVITVEQVQEAQGQATQLPSFDEARDEFTRNYLVQLLQITQGNVSQAARMAKRNRTDFYKLLTKHELKPEEFKD